MKGHSQKVWISGKEYALSASDWIGEGGEGAVYKKNGLAVKLFEAPAAMSRKEPKIAALMGVKEAGLATPVGFAQDAAGSRVGYAMPWLEGYPLARFFSCSWRAQNGVGLNELEKIGRSMSRAIEALHSRGFWGGDINEFNWQIKGVQATLIDCDSWGMPGHPVDAMMPSIADPEAKGAYGPDSDWYARAILLFSMHAGIHPYKGSAGGLGPKDFLARMGSKISLFSPGASWPGSVPGPAGLPPGLAGWLEATLDGGRREPPPSGSWSSKPRSPRPKISSCGEASFENGFGGWAAQGYAIDGDCLLKISSGQRVDMAHPAARGLSSPSGSSPSWIWSEDGFVWIDSGGGPQRFPAQAGSQVSVWDGRAFVFGRGSWQEVALVKLGAKESARVVAQGVCGQEFELLDGCAVCSSMGSLILLRPGPVGLLPMPLRPVEPKARLAMAMHSGSWTVLNWTLSDGSERAQLIEAGSLAAQFDGAADWICRLSNGRALLQADSAGWLVESGRASLWAGWRQRMHVPQASDGRLWIVDDAGAAAASYPISKIQ